jgi:8-oxo-dGTP pyrophosphatase MutT (NUDIX family)
MGWQDKLGAQDAGRAGEARIQYAALCWRESGVASGIEVLLITSRDTGRWIIPKGWPIPGLAPEAAAAEEAWEEAGAQGVVNPMCVGRYGYQKCLSPKAQVPCAVAVYGLQVMHLADSFPEVSQRRRQWFPTETAATMVNEPDLGHLIGTFVPPPSGRLAPIAGE